MKKDTDMELLAMAEGLNDQSVESMRNMAILASAHPQAPELIQAWGPLYSIRRMAVAVKRWPEYFTIIDGMPPRATSVDDCLALFACAGLNRLDGEEMLYDWKYYSLTSWQVKEQIDQKKAAVRCDKGEPKLVIKEATVSEVRPSHLLLHLTDGRMFDEDTRKAFAGQRVRVTVTILPPVESVTE
jgi:hypothetical protein